MEDKFKLGQRVYWINDGDICTNTIKRIIKTYSQDSTETEYAGEIGESLYFSDTDDYFASLSECIENIKVYDENGDAMTVKEYNLKRVK